MLCKIPRSDNVLALFKNIFCMLAKIPVRQMLWYCLSRQPPCLARETWIFFGSTIFSSLALSRTFFNLDKSFSSCCENTKRVVIRKICSQDVLFQHIRQTSCKVGYFADSIILYVFLSVYIYVTFLHLCILWRNLDLNS